MEFKIKIASCEEHRPTPQDRIKDREHSLKMSGQVLYIEAEDKESAIKKAINYTLYANVPGTVASFNRNREEIEEAWPIPERESWPLGIVEISYEEDGSSIVEKYCDAYHVPNPIHRYKHLENGKIIDTLTINTDTNPAYVDNALVNIEEYILSQIDEEEECPEKQAPYRQILLDFVNRYGEHVNYGSEIKNWRSR